MGTKVIGRNKIFALFNNSFPFRIVIGGWLFSSLVMTASYGGNLRAFLLRPQYSKPINNMEDVVTSGLPWTMALYGEEVELYLARSEDPVEKRFWEGKTVIPYTDFPIVEMREVFEGRRVFVEWKPIVDLLIGKFLRRPDGDLLVHYTYKLLHHVNGGYDVVSFYAVNPWYKQFNKILYTYKETGLLKRWKDSSITFFSNRYMVKHGKELEFLNEDNEQRFMKMSLDSLYGAMIGFALVNVIGSVIFLLELCGGKKRGLMLRQTVVVQLRHM